MDICSYQETLMASAIEEDHAWMQIVQERLLIKMGREQQQASPLECVPFQVMHRVASALASTGVPSATSCL